MNASSRTAADAAAAAPSVSASLVAWTGAEPAGVWAAPGRINLVGDHTDYSAGLALPAAIDRRALVAAARRPDGRLRIRSRQRPGAVDVRVADLAPGSVPGWAGYVAGVFWSLRAAGHPVGGADLLVDGNVPIGAGLSSSAAVECAVTAAADDLYDLGLPPVERARRARHAENAFVGVPCGPLDQIASVFGRADHALEIDFRSTAIVHHRLELAAHGLELLVIDTRTGHDHADSGYADRRSSCDRAAARLGVENLRELDPDGADPDAVARAVAGRLDDGTARRVRHVLTENGRVRAAAAALRDGHPDRLGPIFTASHRSLRDDYEVSCPQLDTAVRIALDNGALGARMTGGGFGGCAIALVPVDRAGAVADAVGPGFARAGWPSPVVFPAVPADGAGRVAFPRPTA